MMDPETFEREMNPDEQTLAVLLEDGDPETFERAYAVFRLADAVANAKYLAERWPHRRFNVYKLVATHTFTGL
jgi:hypothetical protein